MFPCFKCGNPFNQMSDTLNYTKQNGVKYNTLWYDQLPHFNLQPLIIVSIYSPVSPFLLYSFSLPRRLDIEGSQYWGSVSDNVNFFQQLVNAGEHLGTLRAERGEIGVVGETGEQMVFLTHQKGATMGVYTSSSQWTPIMGSSTSGSAYPLWYAHYISFRSFPLF